MTSKDVKNNTFSEYVGVHGLHPLIEKRARMMGGGVAELQNMHGT